MDKTEKNSVLIVDDEKTNLEILSLLLSPEYTIFWAENGASAIEMATKHLPDLILLDIVMPGISGYEVLDTLKKSVKTRNIPIIITTGLDGHIEEERALAFNAVDFINKPYNERIVRLRVLNQIKNVNQIRAIKEYSYSLEHNLSKMEAMVNNYKGIIWSVDTEGIINSFNGQYLTVLDIEPESMVGKSLCTALGQSGNHEIKSGLDKTIREGPQEWSSEIDGRIFQMNTVPLFNSEGNVLGIVGSSDDVTELVRLHAAIAASGEKSKFFAKMSHEMRTPLNAVIGLSEVTLVEGGLSEAAHDNVEKICNAGASLLHIVNDILDISKLESGKFKIIPVEYDTASLISDSITQSIVHKGEKPIEFTLNIDENIPKHLFGDDIRIKQVLNNLLSNAFKYTREGTVELNISCEPEGDTVWLNAFVRDTGIGISKENLESMFFSDYSQLDVTANRKIEGTGLGMSITKMLLDMMDGSISADSEYGKGSVFYIKLPQKAVTNEIIEPDIVHTLKSFQYSARKFSNKPRKERIILPYARILLVDDVVLNLDVAKGMMKHYLMKIDCVTSGQEAIDAIREEKVRYNAVFMDHMMPGMGGIEAVQIIRNDIGTEYARTVPIIAFTANALPDNEAMFLSNGFQAFLTKPIEGPRLDEIIKQWVRDEEQEKLLVQQTITINGETFFNLRSGKERRTGLADRRRGFDRRMFEQKVEGMDMRKGLERFGGNMESFLQILTSFTSNTRLLLETLKEVNKENLKNYTINVHGIKSSCRGICAEAAGRQAEALELAAKAEDLDFVLRNNPSFIEVVLKLISDIEDVIEKGVLKKDRARPKKGKPYKEALNKLLDACEMYKIEDIETAMDELEWFDYTDDDGLVFWLRDNVNQMNYMDIVEKISNMV